MEFKATIDAKYFKFFAATLEAFSQLGEIVCLEAQNGQFVMSTVDVQRTAQGFTQISRNAFKTFKLLRRGSPESVLRCTVSNKNFSDIFKKNMAASSSNMIKECQIRIVQPSSESDRENVARIYMRLDFKNGVVKKNTLMYYEGSPLIMYFRPSYRYRLECHPHLLKPYMTRFDTRTEYILLAITPNKLILQSSHEKEHDISEGSQLAFNRTATKTDDRIKATLSIPAADFDAYPQSQQQNQYLIVNLRELKTVIEYMEYLNAQLCLEFESAGLPLLCKYTVSGEVFSYFAMQTEARRRDQREEEGASFISDMDTAPTIAPPRSSTHSSNATRSHHREQVAADSTSPHRDSNNNIDSTADTVPYEDNGNQRPSEHLEHSEHETYVSLASSTSTTPGRRKKQRIVESTDGDEHDAPLFYSNNTVTSDRSFKGEESLQGRHREDYSLSSLTLSRTSEQQQQQQQQQQQEQQSGNSDTLNSPPTTGQRLSAMERVRLLQSRNRNKR